MRPPRLRSLRFFAAIAAVSVTTGLAACGASTTGSTSAGSSSNTAAVTSTTASSTSSTASTTDSGSTQAAAPDGGGGPGGGVDVSSVTTVEQLDALIQEAYGEASLGLHRGHQPVESVLNDTLGISHEELHTRMDAGQNLATIADDVGVGSDKLIAALVDSWSPAIDTLEKNGTITAAKADEYRAALKEAFTFKVTWDGQEATPTFSGIA